MELPGRSFLCLRHGVTDWNVRGLFQGRTDIALNEEGIAQAHVAAQRLRSWPPDHVIASPLRRAVQTAEIVASELEAPLTIDHGLIECDFGSLEGRSIAETMKHHGITAMEQLAGVLPMDGEAWSSVSARSLRCIGQRLHRHPEATILFVCHDAVMQAISEALCKSWFKNQYGTPFRFRRAGDLWTVDEVN
jgi:broad specificity phosphatase PhoE